MNGGIYINGQLLPVADRHISALDRGFTLGDGVFETMRAVGGRIFRLREHLARLRNSTDTLRLPIPLTDSQIENAVKETLLANELAEATVRLEVSRGVPLERGLVPPKKAVPTIVIQVTPFAGYPAEKYISGFTAGISSIRRNEFSPTSRIKSANYLDNIFARMEASEKGYDEAIMLDTEGHLSCASTGNVFLATGGSIMTPPPGCGVLAGITRGAVREIVSTIGLTWDERVLGPDDLLNADEAFLTNSLMGIGPLVTVDEKHIGTGRPGQVTLKIREAYLAMIEAFRRG